MATFLWVLVLLAAVTYSSLLLFFYIGLHRLKDGNNSRLYSVAVIVPARNEENNIGRCLNSLLHQDYPPESYQIVVIDDHSSDGTTAVVESYRQRYPGRIDFFQLNDSSSQPSRKSYKKAAIQYGIEHSTSDLIFTIDADCWARPTWISTFTRQFEDDVGMVCGYILFHTTSRDSLFKHLQALEFLGLVTATAGSIGMGVPLTSNGANLAYRREVFDQVNGFHGIDHLPSGDDDLLMHKVHTQTNWKIRFAASLDCQNFTTPEPTWGDFLQQRIRWGSKSIHYHHKMVTSVLAFVYFYYAYLFLGSLYTVFLNPGYWLPLVLFAGKWVLEFLVVRKGCALTSRKKLLPLFPIAEFYQVIYILVVGFLGVFGRYEWKGRVTQNSF